MRLPHARGIMNVTDWMYRSFRPKHHVRCQMPFETPGESMPEPDVALISVEQMRAAPHPRQALLLVEVSDSSLNIDEEKAFDHDAAGVPECWILDVSARQLLVFREPIDDASAPLNFRYKSMQKLSEDANIAPLVDVAATISVAEFLAGV